jgi:hypothetical protein
VEGQQCAVVQRRNGSVLVLIARHPDMPRVVSRDRDRSGELKGQTSINDLLDEPVGAAPVQLALPIVVQVKPGQFRRLS